MGSRVTEAGMFSILRWLLEGWLSTPCVAIGPVSEWPAQMPLERMVIFSGGMCGCLVLRAPMSLGEALQDKTADERSKWRQRGVEDIFGGLTALYFSHLAAQLWDGKAAPLAVYQPAVSDPAMWPDPKPEIAFTVLVGKVPVEIRLWIQDGARVDKGGER